jgi:methionine-rich copper-binding protein CopC
MEGSAVPYRLKTWTILLSAGVFRLLPMLLLPMLLLPMLLLPTPAGYCPPESHGPAPAGSTVKAGELTLLLRYNSRIDRARSRLTLIRPDNSRDTLVIQPNGPPGILTVHVALTPGDYVVRWQVLAVDGHITRGDVPFTVTVP